MIELEIATEDLLKWARYADEIRERTPKSIASALNAFGENLKAGMIDYLAAATGLDAEQVRSVTDIDEASSGHLQWHMDASRALLTSADEWRRPWDSRPSDSQFEQQILLNIETQPGCCEICSELADEGPYTAAQIREMAAKWKDFTPTGLSWLSSLTRNPVTNLIHPNAVLEGSTFASYSLVREMVAARFAGPAVRLTTDVGVMTIGPNHPMLTRRGFVRANELTKRDELLYDTRCEVSFDMRDSIATAQEFTRIHPNFQQMPMVEDVFATFRGIAGYTRIFAVPDDLHGDAIFCDNEVEVVRSAGELLNVLEPCGIEQFGEFSFARSDVELPLVARLRALAAFLKAPLASANRFMRGFVPIFGGSQFNAVAFENASHYRRIVPPTRSEYGLRSSALVARYNISNCFRWKRVLRHEVVPFVGMAYDASTAVGLYNSDGYVVKNCHCGTSQWQGSDRSIPIRFDGDDRMMTPDEIGHELGKAVLHDWIEDIRAIVKD